MNNFGRLYHFLGSIQFAIILIASVAIFVIAGTLLESMTESHRYAAHFTYNNPAFITLLWGFFINILFSALRRWPFQFRHIPFLTTHVGLLMILAGALTKSYYGTQGSMSVMEGSGSQEIFIPDTYVVHVENKDAANPHSQQTSIQYYPLQHTLLKGFSPDLISSKNTEAIKIKLLAYSPHSSEHLEAWFKGNLGYISGIKPFPIHDWDELSLNEPLPSSAQIQIHPAHPEMPIPPTWQIFAGRTASIMEVAKKAYLQGLDIILSDTATQETIFHGPLQQLFDHPLQYSDGRASFELDFNFTLQSGFKDPKLMITLHQDKGLLKVAVPLQGYESLLNINLQSPHLGKAPITVDLHRKPALVFLQDPQENVTIFAFDAAGQAYAENFRNDNLNSLIVYDRGFGGYAVQVQFPYSAYPTSRKERESAMLHHLKLQLKDGQQSAFQLSPPLQMFSAASACNGTDFASNCVEFLSYWNHAHCWLLPENMPLPDTVTAVVACLDWQRIPSQDRKACQWTHILFLELERRLSQGQELRSALQKMGWPLAKQQRLPDDDASLLTLLTQQVFSVADHLPDIESPPVLSAAANARLLSAYFRGYSLHLNNLLTSTTTAEMQEHLHKYFASLGISQDENLSKMMLLECPITPQHREETPQKKLEENMPKVTLEVSKGKKKEWITLTYDRYGQGLKWPLFNGEYLFRFQPQFKTIPYRVRLRNARQINYANSSQPFSYECDLIITDREKNSFVEKTISMNHVHETWQGHRFYLASIAPPHEGAVKRVQIIVNYDPAKYFLTYPGAIILTIGIILLFWMRPYANTR